MNDCICGKLLLFSTDVEVAELMTVTVPAQQF